jgi:alanine racemase
MSDLASHSGYVKCMAANWSAMMRAHARPNEAEIDLSALGDNVALVRSYISPGTAIIASVKANAYGHGIVPVARRLTEVGVEVLATGSIADAIAMRDAGISTPILMMGAAFPSAVPDLLRNELIPTVHCQELADSVVTSAVRRTSVYVKVDCGFGRLGIPLCDADRFVLDLARQPQIEIAGLYTHLPFADADGLSFARDRIARFEGLVTGLERKGLAIPVTQARASAALLAGITDQCTAVSPGALLYGLSPVDPELASPTALRPVLTRIVTRLIQVSPWAGDRSPVYGSRHSPRVRSTTGVVPFGRVDGNRAPRPGQDAFMLVSGVKAPVLGVSLEHAVIDLSDVRRPEVGQDVVVLGQVGEVRIGLDDIARWQGVGVNDVLMSINGRVPARVTG